MRNWTWEDYDTIRKYYPFEGAKIAKRFKGSAIDTIRTRAMRVNTGAPRRFTQEEQDLVQRYGSVLGTAMIFLLPDRSPEEIKKLL